MLPSPTPSIDNDESSQSSSFDNPNEESPPSIPELTQSSSFDNPNEESPPSIPELTVRNTTLPANEGPVLGPDTPSNRSYPFCDADVCPSSSPAELCQNATASNTKKMLPSVHVIFYNLFTVTFVYSNFNV